MATYALEPTYLLMSSSPVMKQSYELTVPPNPRWHICCGEGRCTSELQYL
jgi:hypothetical protein